MKSSSACVSLLACCSLLLAQQSHRRPLPDIPPERSAPAKRTVDLAQVKLEANELATLAQSIPRNVEGVGKGLLPKNLDHKVKRIEKLSKQLRRDLSP
jgi:hypothetical protein